MVDISHWIKFTGAGYTCKMRCSWTNGQA